MVDCSSCGKNLGMLEAKHKEDGKIFCSSCYREHKEEKEKEKLKKVLEKNDKWEYKVIKLPVKGSAGIFGSVKVDSGGGSKLNKLGEKGWELVSVVGSASLGHTTLGTTYGAAAILKRKKA